jgi:hypothetical protein
VDQAPSDRAGFKEHVLAVRNLLTQLTFIHASANLRSAV